MLQELMKGRLCPSPVHMSPAWLATAEGVGSSSPAMTVGWLLLQEALTPHLLPPPAQGLQGSGVRVLLKGLVFSLDPGNTVARALVDPNTDVPCPRRGHPCSPTGWLWGCLLVVGCRRLFPAGSHEAASLEVSGSIRGGCLLDEYIFHY